MKRYQLLAGSVLAALSIPALAHPGGHDAGFWQGFVHPFTGVDHLVAMAFLGFWLSSLSRATASKTLFAAIAVFAGGIVMGGQLSSAQVAWVELSVLASAGVMIVLAGCRAQLGAAAPIVAAAAFAGHGLAHGAEASAQVLPFTVGASLAMAILASVASLTLYSARQRFHKAA
ncbi:MAG TPA: HupE/UreJ family protein [Marinagarivorans sp.]